MAQNSQNLTFSIITVTKDNLAGLRHTHKSLEEQTCKNFEWIVIDGASSDQTKDFLGKTRANWQSEPDEGPFDAMNKGIRKAKGEYLLFLNAGDTLALHDTLEKIEKIAKKSLDFIYGDALETQKSASGVNQEPFYKTAGRYKDLPRGMFTHHQAMFYRHETIKEHQLSYSIIYEIASDYEFTARFLKVAKKMVYAPFPICTFESGGISQQRAQEGRREEFLVRERLKLVTLPKNVWIYTLQTLAWKARQWFPALYKSIKGKKREAEEETTEDETPEKSTKPSAP